MKKSLIFMFAKWSYVGRLISGTPQPKTEEISYCSWSSSGIGSKNFLIKSETNPEICNFNIPVKLHYNSICYSEPQNT